MENMENYITFIMEDGKKEDCKILFTFKSEEFNHNYVVFQTPNDEVSACIFVPTEGGQGTIEKIESDEEWEIVNDAYNQYLDSLENGCQGSCASCGGACSSCDDGECNCGK